VIVVAGHLRPSPIALDIAGKHRLPEHGEVNLSNFLSFGVVAALLTLLPGLDFTLVVKAATTKSKSYAIATALGINTGLFIWGAGAALGITGLLRASHTAFTGLRIIGALYLFWIGANLLWGSWHRKDSQVQQVRLENQSGSQNQSRAFWQGFLTNILNPKVGIFYLSVLPQFIPVQANHLIYGISLTAIHASLSMIYFTILIAFIGKLKPFLQQPRVQAKIERISGIVILAFGVKLVAISR
jgi:threonine/homoserine/homoserine lactone efflux protein